MIDRTVGHYRIVEKLGEGGMGQVWKAVDTKLERDVAIKVLPEHFAEDPDHLARFEREAKLLASLNHRNIASICGLEEEEGRRFLVMELVEGQDLAKLLIHGPLDVEKSIDICHQLARALDAAHEKGVLHRDLKPANVQITPEGRAKVLDFGLAKAFESSGDPMASPTLTSAGTKTGVILGTAAYMSPEQARGQPLDKRTDIFSFGCVLYECLTGRSAFKGHTVSDTLASILKSDPNWAALPAETPPRIRELLQRCLDKDPRNRLRDIGDARVELKRSIAGSVATSQIDPAVSGEIRPVEQKRTAPIWGWVASLLIAAAAGAVLWPMVSGTTGSRGSGGESVARFSVSIPQKLTDVAYRLSPTGGLVVFRARSSVAESDESVSKLYSRRFEEFEVLPFEGSEGVNQFSFSPDGRWLAIVTPVSPGSSKLRLSKLRVDRSAPPQHLVDWQEDWSENDLLWLPGGNLIVQTDNPTGLVRIPASGGGPQAPLKTRTEDFEGTFYMNGSPSAALPDGIHALVTAITWGDKGYDHSIALLDTESGEIGMLIENGSNPLLTPSGQLLFSRGDTLMAAPFDTKQRQPAGVQVTLADGLRNPAVWTDAWFDISLDGTLIHQLGGTVGGKRRLVLFDEETGVVEDWTEDRRPYESNLVTSEDGRKLAVTLVNTGGLYEIWVSDLDRPRLTQLVQAPGSDCMPGGWTPDAERLLYYCGAAERGGYYLRRGDGEGEPELLFEKEHASESRIPHGYLADGSKLILTHVTAGDARLVLVPMDPSPDGRRELEPLLENARNAAVSPDHHWMTYTSDKSGRYEVYLRRLGDDGTLGREIPVSRLGCNATWWRRGAAVPPLEIGYACRNVHYAVTLTTTPDVRLSETRLIGDHSEFHGKRRGGLALLPDGRAIAVYQGDDEVPPQEINVVLNWFSELESRIAAAR